ncbi:uncharacterized protein LOC114942364, partial [Nylanderia fulva]|uniref:uncharacterized protein LOC114942364 n=1 Tax=Nylanderia fulva TaxID=613905 RepID=UPI0010FB5B85
YFRIDVSSVIVAATIAGDSKTSRYDSYNLDKGPVFYEAYYPDYVHDTHIEKRNLDENQKVLETSFQVPFERFAYSAEMMLEDNKNHRQTASIDEISRLVRRAISRDLENWNILEKYLSDQNWLMQPRVYPKEEDNNNRSPFQNNRQRSFDQSGHPNLGILQKLVARDANKQHPNFEEGNTMMKKMMSDNRDVQLSIDVASGLPSLPENIFQPRPQIIRYTFFRKPIPQFAQQAEKIIDTYPTPRNYGDNLIRQENKKSRVEKNNVKITSIEVSELPRHKTRHHHGEWPKRDYSIHRQSEEKKETKADT